MKFPGSGKDQQKQDQTTLRETNALMQREDGVCDWALFDGRFENATTAETSSITNPAHLKTSTVPKSLSVW
jgi:hypothetical protein